MRKYTKRLFCILLVVMVAFVSMPPITVHAAGDIDYTVVVEYRDSVQMQYIVRHGIDDWWTGRGDVPIGGVSATIGGGVLSQQVYCIDAKVAFHSEVGKVGGGTSYSGVVTTDTAPGYAVASPLVLSDTVRANLPSLYWLAMNGFNGDFDGVNNLSSIQSTYGALSSLHGGEPIDATIALMATKAAMWHFTDPTFALLSTSLNPIPANATLTQKNRYELMVNLMKAMIADAKTGGSSIATTKLEVNFDLSTGPAALSALDNGFYYFGPITATETEKQPGGASASPGTPKDIFLSASGIGASDIIFVNGGSNSATELPKGELYGTNEMGPYIANGVSFYLKIPAVSSSLHSMGVGNTNPFHYLALHGLGKAEGVLYEGTPAVIVGQDISTGAQDWNRIQAFIGFVESAHASLYGEGSVLLKANTDNLTIHISKSVGGATNDISSVADIQWVFGLEVRGATESTWGPVPLELGTNITGAGSVNGNLFTLKDGDVAVITGLPQGRYRITEQQVTGSYTPSFDARDSYNNLSFGTSAYDPATASFEGALDSNAHLAGYLTVTNTILPNPPQPPGPSPQGPSPRTGDSSDIPLWAVVGCIGLAGLGLCVAVRKRMYGKANR
jgi:hypothetical protein